LSAATCGPHSDYPTTRPFSVPHVFIGRYQFSVPRGANFVERNAEVLPVPTIDERLYER